MQCLMSLRFCSCSAKHELPLEIAWYTAQVGSALLDDPEAAMETVGVKAESDVAGGDPGELRAAVSAVGGSTTAVKRELEDDPQSDGLLKRVKTEPV